MSPLSRRGLVSCVVWIAIHGVAAASVAAQGADATPSAPHFDLGASLLKTLLSLGVVIALLALGLRVLARWNQTCARTQPSARIEVLETRRLEAKRALHVVRVEGRRWLVASCEGSMSLTALADDDRACESNAAPAASPAPSRFASLFLGRAIGGQS